MTKIEDKVLIKQFKDGSSNFWCNYAHYNLNENNELIWCSGETDKVKLRELILSFIKRNKKIYKPREISQIDIPQKEYLEKITFGKYSGMTVRDVFEQDKRYLTWMIKEYKFNSSQEKLKQEIIEIIK